jgi:hypothetical protein
MAAAEARVTAGRRQFLAAILTLAFLGCASAPPPAPAPKTDSDEFQIESTVLAVYNVISGPAGRRDWDRFKDLFAPGARLISVHKETNVMTPDEFVAKSTPYLQANGFFERPVETRIERFRDIAQVYSRYESRHASNDEKPFARGVNSFQLVRDGDRWRVLTILWTEEN